MWRFSGGRLIFCSLSNSTLSLRVIVPDCGVTKPATRLIKLDFPAPERPKIAVTPLAGISILRLSDNAPSVFFTLIFNI
nr:MAG TPA: hypothetical protein [Caudoviricetes sp.]